MRHPSYLQRAALAAAIGVLSGVHVPRAQVAIPPMDPRITYILPRWQPLDTASEEAFRTEIREIRSRIGEGPRHGLTWAQPIVAERRRPLGQLRPYPATNRAPERRGW